MTLPKEQLREQHSEQSILKHVKTTLSVAMWRWLARRGIGDPLNQLVYIHKYQPHRRK